MANVLRSLAVDIEEQEAKGGALYTNPFHHRMVLEAVILFHRQGKILVSNMQMNNYRYLMYSVVLTIFGFGIWIALEDHEKFFQAIQQVGWIGFAFLCLLSLINYLLRYIRWTVLLKFLGDRVPYQDGIICYISGLALTTTPAKAGETIRCLYFYRRHNIHYSHTLATILTERTTDAIASMVIACAALYSFSQMRWIGVGFALFIITLVMMIMRPALLLRITELFRPLKLTIVQKLLDIVPVFLARSAVLFAFRPFATGFIFAFFAWSAEAYAFAWLAHTLGGEAPTILYMSIFATGMVAGALTFLPGGLGGAEVVLYLLLVATGLGDAEAVTVTVLCRLTTLWFAVVLGLLSVLWLESVPFDTKALEKKL